MKKCEHVTIFLYLVLIFTATSAARCESAQLPPLPDAVRSAGMTEQIFFDDFDHLNLSGTRKGAQVPTWYNEVWHQKERSLDRYSVKDGVLHILSEPNGRDSSLTTVSRDGKAGKRFRFGYFEARMKWDDDPKTWAAFWLFSFTHMMGTDNNNWCEIDVIESMRPKTFSGTAHDWKNFKTTYNPNNNHYLGPEFEPNQWHTYGTLFDRDKITWFYDGKAIFSTSTPLPCKEQELFLVLSSQQHGIGPGAHPDPMQTYIQKSVYFDWVRVYSRP